MAKKGIYSLLGCGGNEEDHQEMVFHENAEQTERCRSDSFFSVYSEYNDDDDDQGSYEPLIKPRGAATFASYMNLTNTCIGAGCLALPYAVVNCGLILGIILVVLSALMQLFSLHILSICAAKVENPSFYTVCQASVPRMTFLVDLAVVLQSFGVCTSYLIVISDLMPDVMNNFKVEGVWQKRPLWVLLAFAVCFPLSCFRKLDALRYTSGLSVLFVLFLMLMILFYAIPGDGLHPCQSVDAGEVCVGEKPLISVSTTTFQVFGIITNAYSCQSNVFSVVNELRNPTQPRVDFITSSSILTALGVYSIVAISGFFTYGTEVESNIMLNYPTSHFVSVGRLFVSFLTAFSFPIVFQPGRNSFLGLWRFMDKSEDAWIRHKSFRYISVTLCTLVLSLFVALQVDDLGIMFSFVGATGATTVSFILPGAAYYHMHAKPEVSFCDQDLFTKLSYLLFIAGCIFAPMGVAFLFVPNS